MYRLRNSHFRVAIWAFGALLLVSGLFGCAAAAEQSGTTSSSVGGSVGPTTTIRPAGSPATVARIVDGDTIVAAVDGREERVRLIGIDTPETVDPRKPVQCFGKEASAYLAELIAPGTAISLVSDVESRDRFGRRLAYVYRLADDRFVNLALVEDGYARVATYPPNVRYAEEFRAAERAARDANRGLWRAC